MLVIGGFFSVLKFFLYLLFPCWKFPFFSFVLSTFLIIYCGIFMLPPWNLVKQFKHLWHLSTEVSWVSFFIQAEIFWVSCMMNDFLLKIGHLGYCVRWVWILFKHSVSDCLCRHCSTSVRVNVSSILPGEHESQRSPLSLCCQPMGRIFSLLLDEDEIFSSPLNLLWQHPCRKVGRWLFITSESGSLSSPIGLWWWGHSFYWNG